MVAHKVAAIVRSWLPLAVGIVMIAGVAYLTTQQVMRQGANDPQIQMAEDTASLLATGEPLPAGAPVDIAASLAPYLIQFDSQGNPTGGTARLHGNLPTVPQGALDYARRHGENRVTWQPERGVRSATVIVPVQGAAGGYVLAGRSLREVEKRDGNILALVTLGTLAALAATLLVTVVFNLIDLPAGS
jgi:hypothetical protein